MDEENKMVTCERCGKVVPEDDAHYLDGEDAFVCQRCYDNHVASCYECEREFILEHLESVDDCERYVCRDCLENNSDRYHYCDRCGDWHTGESYYISDAEESWCESCTENHSSMCDVCEETHTNEDISELYGGGAICNSCFNNGDYDTCDNCGCVVSRSDSVYDEQNDSVLCPDCYERLQRSRGCPDSRPPRTLLCYHENTARVFFNSDPDRNPGRYFGIELEVDGVNRSENFSTVLCKTLDILDKDENDKDLNHWTAMRDGSLRNSGMELISQPMTSSFFDTAGCIDRLSKAMRYLISVGYRSHDTDTCGLHFHVSRDALSVEQMVNMDVLCDRFWDVVVKLSRREEGGLHWCKKSDANNKTEGELCRLCDPGEAYERYQILNFTNRDTVELRIFRGTLKINSFLAAMHFFRFIIEFSDALTFRQAKRITQEKFLSAMGSYSSELKTYMIERNVIPPENTEPDPILLAWRDYREAIEAQHKTAA